MENFPRPFKCKFFLPPLGCLFCGRERGSGVEFYQECFYLLNQSSNVFHGRAQMTKYIFITGGLFHHWGKGLRLLLSAAF